MIHLNVYVNENRLQEAHEFEGDLKGDGDEVVV